MAPRRSALVSTGEGGKIAELAGGDWRAFGPSGPSAADLFNPADFEARLSEARVRRKKALAKRDGNREVISPGLPAPPPPMAAGWDRWGFLAGLAAGAIAALTAHQLLSPVSLPPPYVGELPLAPAPPELPVPISVSLSFDAYGPQALLTAVENVLPEASLAAPEPWQGKVPALISKVRLAGPPPPALLGMERAPSRSVSRATLFQEYSADGHAAGGAPIADLVRAFHSATDPVTSDRPHVDKPARPQEPRASRLRPRVSIPPASEPRPPTQPDQTNQGSRPTRDRQRAEPGRTTAGRASHDRGAADHAQGNGRGDGSARGARNESHGSGRSNDSGKGKGDDDKSGHGNGGGGKGGGGRADHGNGGGSGKGGNGNGGGGSGKGRG
jgi:hypothetical protein